MHSFWDMQPDKQTDKQTYSSQYFTPLPGNDEVNIGTARKLQEILTDGGAASLWDTGSTLGTLYQAHTTFIIRAILIIKLTNVCFILHNFYD